VQKHRKTCTDPIAVGDLYADGIKGKEAFQNIIFEEKHDGPLQIWKYPHDVLPEKGGVVRDRYAAFADIGGKTAKADYSVVSLFDRYWMMDGGVTERVALWRGHLDQDLFAWKAAQLAYFYDQALLAVERNSLRSKGLDTEGQHHLTVLDEIKEDYPNLFARNAPDKVREGMPLKWGFMTGPGTKEMILNSLNAALRDDLYYETALIACDEMDYFEVKEDGTLGAKDGQNDDVLITTAGGVWLSNEHMPLPSVYTPKSKVERLRKKGNYGYATV
jgi:hypothetical protein